MLLSTKSRSSLSRSIYFDAGPKDTRCRRSLLFLCCMSRCFAAAGFDWAVCRRPFDECSDEVVLVRAGFRNLRELFVDESIIWAFTLCFLLIFRDSDSSHWLWAASVVSTLKFSFD